MSNQKVIKWLVISWMIVIVVGVVAYCCWTIPGTATASRQIRTAEMEAAQLGIIYPNTPTYLPSDSAYGTYQSMYKAEKRIFDLLYHFPDPRNLGTQDRSWYPISQMSPAEFANFQKLLAPVVPILTKASHLPYCGNGLGQHDWASEPLDSLTDLRSKTATWTLGYDALAQLRAGNKVRIGADLLAMGRIGNQVARGNTIIAALVGDQIQNIQLGVISDVLAQHPGEAGWANAVLPSLIAWKEPSYFAADPNEWQYGQTLTDKAYNAAVYLTLKFGPNASRYKALIYTAILKRAEADQYQFSSFGVWRSKIDQADRYPADDGGLDSMALFCVTGRGEVVTATLRMRLIVSMLTAFAEGSIIKGQTGKWPTKLVFAKDEFVPLQNPIPSVSSAKPMYTASKMDPFTGEPIKLEKIKNGWAWVSEVPASLIHIAHPEVTVPSEFERVGETAYVIQLVGSKVKLYNVYRL